MKKILFLPFGLLSHYLRLLEFASVLRDIYPIEGVFLSHPAYDAFTEKKGFKRTNLTFPAFLNDVNNYAVRFNFDWINQKTILSTIRYLENIVEEEKPDIIVSDTFLGVRILTEKWKIPHVALLNAYVTNHYAGFRDVPHHHKANRFRKYLSPNRWENLVRTIENITLKKVHSPFRKIRKKDGLALYDNLFDEFLGEINLLCDDPDIFPLKKNLSHYHYVGPILFRDNEKDNELLDFLEKNSAKPVVYVTTGSSGFQIIPDKLKPQEFQDFIFIVTGAKKSEQDGNALFRSYVNFDTIKAKVSLVINHGGNGSMYQALNAGLPIISIPRNFEQEWNVQRFSFLGLCHVHYPDEPEEKLIKLIKELTGSEQNLEFKNKYSNENLKEVLKSFKFFA